MLIWVGLAYHIASRLAYVVWVGIALTRQQRRQAAAPDTDFEEHYRAFRRRASLLMASDGVSFVLLCLLTRSSLPWEIGSGLRWGAGAVLAAVGIGTKVWAARTLGDKAYYWHNFFATGEDAPAEPRGPYRYISNPMYTVGYLQTYGLALALGSLPGLVAALFDQAAILLFHVRVERPHYHALIDTETGAR